MDIIDEFIKVMKENGYTEKDISFINFFPDEDSINLKKGSYTLEEVRHLTEDYLYNDAFVFHLIQVVLKDNVFLDNYLQYDYEHIRIIKTPCKISG